MTAPVAYPVVTCEYGVKGTWACGYHPGRDYHAAVGTPVMATFPGVVASVDNAWGSDYGNHVVIESKNRFGQLVRHGYCHLSRITVQVGEKVDAGDHIGLSGDTGRTFGPHLHYEERFAPFTYHDRDRVPWFPGWTLAAIARYITKRRRPADHPKAGA